MRSLLGTIGHFFELNTYSFAEGRLHQACLDLLKGSDIQFHRHSRLDIALCMNLPLALIFLPAADIPRFVGEGRVALGITGHDQVRESETTEVEQILDLGFGKCKLQVQVPEKGEFSDPSMLVGKNIVTSFTQLTKKFFTKLEEEAEAKGQKNVVGSTKIKYVGGSVEAACALGVADGIVDLVGESFQLH
jgi:ATP phosphoribosyltransferase